MSKLKLAFTVLLIVTIAWGIVFYTDFQRSRGCLAIIERFGEGNIVLELLFYSIATYSGFIMTFIGVFLGMTWAVFVCSSPIGEGLSALVAAIRRTFQNEKRS